MPHTIHVLTNSQDEAYIRVINKKSALETIVGEVDTATPHFEKKNSALVRYVRDNFNDLSLEHISVPTELKDINEIRQYRDDVITQYASNGYLVIDDKHYELMDAPADKHFGDILALIDIKKSIAKFGQKTLVSARKSMTVGEFLEKFEA